MRLASAACVRLKRALTLCHVDSVLPELSVETRPVKLPILAVARSQCQKKALNHGVLQFAGVWSGVFMRCRHCPPFGFSPKISTPVENTVEKQVKWPSYRWKSLIYRDFGEGEGCRRHSFLASARARC